MGSYWKNLAWIGFGATSAWIWRHVGLGLAPRRLGIDGNHANRQRDKSHGLWDGVAKRLGGRGRHSYRVGRARVGENIGSQLGFARKPFNSHDS
jgi:hypothetical protein